jgi:hypothetical protein
MKHALFLILVWTFMLLSILHELGALRWLTWL